MARTLSARGGMSSAWGEALVRVPPSAFSFVMATGIVSTGLAMTGREPASIALLWIAVTGLLVLAAVLAVRALRYPQMVIRDACDPRRAFGFFTVVAALNVIGARSYSPDVLVPTIVLLLISAPLWAVLVYGVPAALILRVNPGPAAEHVDGGWFLCVVGTQSLSIVLAVLSPDIGDWAAPVAVALWAIASVLYLLLASLILLRLLTAPGSPDSFAPSYWIFTGATAISALAGAHILDLPRSQTIIAATAPFVTGASFALWAFGTWWIPLLIIFGIWRHLIRRRPLRYEVGLWSIVFPLGMYAVASMVLADAAGLPFLRPIGEVGTVVAAAVWLAVAAAAAVAAARGVSRRTTAVSPRPEPRLS